MAGELTTVNIPPGRYILALSGGVDSMSLLDLLSDQSDVELILAHFDHGIRTDGSADKRLVEKVAKKYGLTLEVGQVKLGPDASEEQARTARYAFLNELKAKHSAQAIITAHHQDDLIETAFLNLLRGSGRRGLSAIASSDILRPLLGVPKSQIINYARQKNLQWREDSTNRDPKYLRNYLRNETLSSLDDSKRRRLVKSLEKAAKTNQELDRQIATLSQIIKPKASINRSQFIKLPLEIGDELVMQWLRQNGLRQFDRKTVQRLAMAIKTAQPGNKQVIRKDFWLKIDQTSVHFMRSD